MTTPGIVLMESDATPAEALPRVLAALVQLLNQESLVWLVLSPASQHTFLQLQGRPRRRGVRDRGWETELRRVPSTRTRTRSCGPAALFGSTRAHAGQRLSLYLSRLGAALASSSMDGWLCAHNIYGLATVLPKLCGQVLVVERRSPRTRGDNKLRPWAACSSNTWSVKKKLRSGSSLQCPRHENGKRRTNDLVVIALIWTITWRFHHVHSDRGSRMSARRLLYTIVPSAEAPCSGALTRRTRTHTLRARF